MIRYHIGCDNFNIDGRVIPYSIVTALDYLQKVKGMSEDECDQWIGIDPNYEIWVLINQIMAIKQSCFLLQHTSHSCQSLSDDLYNLKLRLILELKDDYNFEFDDDFVDGYVKRAR